MSGMAYTKELAEAVKARRLELGYGTRRALAAAAHLSERSMQQIENGEKGSYRSDTLIAIDRALGWTLGSAERVLHSGDRPVPVSDVSAGRAIVDPMVIDIPDSVVLGLSPEELVEVRATATAAFLARAREIAASRGGVPLR